MIAADTSVIIDFFQGRETTCTRQIRYALDRGMLVLPPASVTELFSNHEARKDVEELVAAVEILSITSDYLQRAGLLRAKIRKSGHKATLGDALIAQSCIDHSVPLLTTDTDFRHYAKAGGLKLA